MLLYWKYRECNKLLALPSGTSWYMTCESDSRGNYMLVLFSNGVKMMIEDGYIYSVNGPEMDDSELRGFFNSIIENVASVAVDSPKIIDVEEIKRSLLSAKYPDFVFDEYGGEDGEEDEDDDYASDYDIDEEYY